MELLTLNLPDMLWVKDVKGTYMYVNQAMCDGLLMAKDTNEAVGKNDLFFALREREKYKNNPDWHTFGELCFDSDLLVIEENKAMKFEEYGNIKGNMLYLEVFKAPFYNQDGEILGTVGTGRDITEIKIIQLDLEEKNKQLAKQSREIEEFNNILEIRVQEEILKSQNQESILIHQSRQVVMGEMLESIAHQWRQPLNIISLTSARLEMQYQLHGFDSNSFEETMKLLSTNINYMSNTIDDFRKFLNPNKIKSTFSIVSAIQEVSLIIKDQIEAYNIQSTLELTNDITINGFENEFKQVMLILLNNSIDAIKGRVENKKIKQGKINTTVFTKNGINYIEIKDNGGGISQEIINKIFEAYFTTKSISNGTGVGLYIAKNIIENRMKGTIVAQNIENGSCFRIGFAS